MNKEELVDALLGAARRRRQDFQLACGSVLASHTTPN